MIVRFGQRMRQAFFQQGNPPAPVQKAPKSCRPGVRAELLVSELDLNGLMGGFELNFRCHRLVSWACARRLIGFIHKNNQSTNGGLSPTALLRLSVVRARLYHDPTATAMTLVRPGGTSPFPPCPHVTTVPSRFTARS